MEMNTKLLVALLTAIGLSLALGVGKASAWLRDPDTMSTTAVLAQLVPPDATIGDSDTTAVGVGDEAVGADPQAAPSDPPDSHTLFVDNTPTNGDCPATPYTMIQSAVDASGPGATIKVCPGTYPEQVRITGHMHDKLKLESLKPLKATIQWPTPETMPFVLVDIKTADHVRLTGFVVTGPFPACGSEGERHEGVLVENASDAEIDRNHITQIRSVTPAGRGCQGGDAVAIGRRSDPQNTLTDLPASARVHDNVIDLQQKNGIQAVNNGTFVHADHNTIVGPGLPAQPYAAPNGVVVFRQAAGHVDHNTISNNHFTGNTAVAQGGGIILANTPSGSSKIDHNAIYNNDYGIETDTQTNMTIEHNDVYENAFDGIVLCGDATQNCGPASGLVVRDNKISYNGFNGGSGILMLNADANLIKSNKIEHNGDPDGDTTDGLRVDSNSGNNEIDENQLDQNVHHDCHDDSNGTGSGTPPTANIWKNDSGDTQNRDGLCKGAATTT
jgi:Right handed beta helix region